MSQMSRPLRPLNGISGNDCQCRAALRRHADASSCRTFMTSIAQPVIRPVLLGNTRSVQKKGTSCSSVDGLIIKFRLEVCDTPAGSQYTVARSRMSQMSRPLRPVNGISGKGCQRRAALRRHADASSCRKFMTSIAQPVIRPVSL